MARTAGNKAYNTFVGGLISEATGLSFPENACEDMDNVIPSNKGNSFVRTGIDYEAGYQVASFTKSLAVNNTSAYKTFEWNDVGNDSSVNFLVVQLGDTLHFWSLNSAAISTDEQSFTIDMNTFKVGATVGSSRVAMDSGNGWLFVASEEIKPFWVKYDNPGITASEIGIRVRDTEGLDDGTEPDEEPTTLSTEKNYNLKNQGWLAPATGGTNPITSYFSSRGEYPPNSKQWWIAKNASDNFDPVELSKIYLGNTLSPRGHYILDPFNKDRTTASGVSGITTEVSTSRPNCIAFFAGRAWYGHEGKVYFSQILESESNIGRCYQSADPTAEDINEIVDTDGGVVPLPEAGSFKRFFVTGDSLLVMASNGVWEIAGSVGSGFRPTDYSVNEVGTAGLLSPESVVDIDGIPMWFSDRGIYTVTRSQTTDRLVTQSLSENTIQSYYESTIPDLSKEYATGTYDPINRKVQWLWKSDASVSEALYNYNRVLNFDVRLGAFYPWSIEDVSGSTVAHLAGVFVTDALNNLGTTQNVVDSSLTQVVTSGGDTVTADVDVLTDGTSQIKYLVAIVGASDVSYTFSNLTDDTHVDWATVDGTGTNVSAYMDTGFLLEGDIQNWKQQPYVYFFFDQRAGNESCFVQYKWDWASSGNSGKWSTKRQVYRSRDNYSVAVSRQKVRGKGKALQIRFENEAGKGFDLLGWSGKYETTTSP